MMSGWSAISSACVLVLRRLTGQGPEGKQQDAEGKQQDAEGKQQDAEGKQQDALVSWAGLYDIRDLIFDA